MFFPKKHPNVDDTIIKLVNRLKIPLTRQSSIMEPGQNSDYLSLLSISDVLNQLNVLNAAYNVSAELLSCISLSFIAYPGYYINTCFKTSRSKSLKIIWPN